MTIHKQVTSTISSRVSSEVDSRTILDAIHCWARLHKGIIAFRHNTVGIIIKSATRNPTLKSI